MKMVPVSSPSLWEIGVVCCRCKKWVSLNDAYADLEGTAFEDYYCQECKEIAEKEASL